MNNESYRERPASALESKTGKTEKEVSEQIARITGKLILRAAQRAENPALESVGRNSMTFIKDLGKTGPFREPKPIILSKRKNMLGKTKGVDMQRGEKGFYQDTITTHDEAGPRDSWFKRTALGHTDMLDEGEVEAIGAKGQGTIQSLDSKISLAADILSDVRGGLALQQTEQSGEKPSAYASSANPEVPVLDRAA